MLHFLRPWWFLAFIPWAIVLYGLWKESWFARSVWERVCDKALLDVMQHERHHRTIAWLPLSLWASVFFVLIALTGPCWSKYPLPNLQPIYPKVIVLDMSPDMLESDWRPSRLERVKLLLHSLLQTDAQAWLSMIVFSSEPFTVSPLTEDTKTIDSLLDELHPDILPVSGYNLVSALEEAHRLIEESGFQTGSILVMTGRAPDPQAIELVSDWATAGITTSLLPLARHEKSTNTQALVEEGHGRLYDMNTARADLKHWLLAQDRSLTKWLQRENISVWKDEGYWFIVLAFLPLLILFRRGTYLWPSA